MFQPWWERFPGRLAYELEKLREMGISCEPIFTGGIVSLNFEYFLNSESIGPLTIRFPCSYPFLRFTVEAPKLSLKHHQNPKSNDVCILGRDTTNWQTTDTVAETLITQMPKVIKAGMSDVIDDVNGIEDAQPEPFTAYFNPEGNILIDGSYFLGENYTEKFGSLKIGISEKSDLFVLSVIDSSGREILKAHPSIEKIYRRTIKGRWLKTNENIFESQWPVAVEKLFSVNSKFSKPQWQPVNKKFLDIIAVIFPEEVEYRKIGEGWFFLVREKK